MKDRAPVLVRAWLVLNRMMSAVWRGFLMIRDETLWAWTSEPDRERTNRAIFDRQQTYTQGGEWFEEGLFEWERLAIQSPHFPATGRILLGAAGGGRELVTLCGVGYRVVAFEPAPRLAEAARAAIASQPESVVICASYADLVEAAANDSGPLAPCVLGKEIDGIILGWTSFDHVWRKDREALLKALKTLAPRAPVLVSYLEPEASSEGTLGTVRIWFRGILRVLGARYLAELGDVFVPTLGFYQTSTAAEIGSLAERAGYKAIFPDTPGTPHAILIPQL